MVEEKVLDWRKGTYAVNYLQKSPQSMTCKHRSFPNHINNDRFIYEHYKIENTNTSKKFFLKGFLTICQKAFIKDTF